MTPLKQSAIIRLDRSNVRTGTIKTNGENGSATKSLILKRATALFREKGYHAASMRDIAKASGLALPSIYHYFPRKEAILESAVAPNILFPLLESAAAGPQPVEEKLRRLIRHLVENVLELQDQYLVLLCDMRSLPSEARAELQQSLRRRRKVVEQLIAEGVETGVFAVNNPAFIVMNLMRMLDSIALWYRSDGPRSPEEIAAEITDFAISGLRGERPHR